MTDVDIPAAPEVSPLAVGPIPTVAADQPIASVWGNTVADTVNFLRNPPSCRIYNNANFPMSTGVTTPLTFNTERWDTDAMHDPAVNPGRITFKTAGLYLVTLGLEYTGRADWLNEYGGIRLNGATPPIVAASGGTITVATIPPLLALAGIYKFAVGQWIDAVAYGHNTASAAFNIVGGNGASLEFGATWIGLG